MWAGEFVNVSCGVGVGPLGDHICGHYIDNSVLFEGFADVDICVSVDYAGGAVFGYKFHDPSASGLNSDGGSLCHRLDVLGNCGIPIVMSLVFLIVVTVSYSIIIPVFSFLFVFRLLRLLRVLHHNCFFFILLHVYILLLIRFLHLLCLLLLLFNHFLLPHHYWRLQSCFLHRHYRCCHLNCHGTSFLPHIPLLLAHHLGHLGLFIHLLDLLFSPSSWPGSSLPSLVSLFLFTFLSFTSFSWSSFPSWSFLSSYLHSFPSSSSQLSSYLLCSS